MTDVIARIRSGDLAAGERAMLADLVAALLGLVEAENAARRTADLQADSETRVAGNRARVDAQLALFLAGEPDPRP